MHRTRPFSWRRASTSIEFSAVYKPRRGERPLWDFPHGTLCNREVAAYELSRALQWGVVPVTILRDGPLGEGAVQRFVEHDPNEHYFTLLEGREDRFRQFAVFDVLANNTDRKGGHCLHDEVNDLVVGIDHGLTFHPAWKLRTVIWDFAGERIAAADSDDVCRDARRARRRPTRRAALRAPHRGRGRVDRVPRQGPPRGRLPLPRRRLPQHPLAPRVALPSSVLASLSGPIGPDPGTPER